MHFNYRTIIYSTSSNIEDWVMNWNENYDENRGDRRVPVLENWAVEVSLYLFLYFIYICISSVFVHVFVIVFELWGELWRSQRPCFGELGRWSFSFDLWDLVVKQSFRVITLIIKIYYCFCLSFIINYLLFVIVVKQSLRVITLIINIYYCFFVYHLLFILLIFMRRILLIAFKDILMIFTMSILNTVSQKERKESCSWFKST